MSKTLHLTLQKKWFDRHQQDKTEDYREIKPHWASRLCDCHFGWDSHGMLKSPKSIKFKQFDTATFTNGYGSHMPTMVKKFKGIRIGRGNPEWGAPTDRDVFIIECGKILTTKNISNE